MFSNRFKILIASLLLFGVLLLLSVNQLSLDQRVNRLENTPKPSRVITQMVLATPTASPSATPKLLKRFK